MMTSKSISMPNAINTMHITMEWALPTCAPAGGFDTRRGRKAAIQAAAIPNVQDLQKLVMRVDVFNATQHKRSLSSRLHPVSHERRIENHSERFGPSEVSPREGSIFSKRAHEKTIQDGQ